jgi:hypothetical protein
MKLKHSKFKNTGILFELLVRQIASDTLENKDSKAIDIIKKYFTHTELAKEYKLYKTIMSANTISEQKADMYITATLDAQKNLNQTSLRKEKYKLISEIKKNYDIETFFRSKIDHYKEMASIYMLFESESSDKKLDPTSYTEYKYGILEHLTRSTKKDKEQEVSLINEFHTLDKDTRLLTYKFLLDKFNKKYNNSLTDRQKNLIKEYVNNISTTTKLKDYLNEQYSVVKKELKKTLSTINDERTKIKVSQVIDIIQEIPKTKNAGDSDVLNLFSYYELIEELNKVK